MERVQVMKQDTYNQSPLLNQCLHLPLLWHLHQSVVLYKPLRRKETLLPWLLKLQEVV
jgi:hypothetical protein